MTVPVHLNRVVIILTKLVLSLGIAK
jgi:hypothetical protein